MITAVSKLSAGLYKGAFKPLLFLQQPDAVHRRLLVTGSSLQRIAPVRGLLGTCWAYHNPNALAQTLHGLQFNNPVGLSAGFDKNFQLVPLIKSIGFGFMEGGSLTYRPCEGNPRPWFYRLPKTKSIVVNAGLANEGVVKIISRIKRYPARLFGSFPLNVSVAKTNSPEACTTESAITDYVGSLRVLKKAGVGQMITLNISCPNTYGGEPFTEPVKLEKLLSAVDKLKLKQPLFIKMPNDMAWSAFAQLLAVADKHKVAGLIISNLTHNRSPASLADPLPDSVKGKLSGKPTFKSSNEAIKRTYQTYGDRFTIIGVGGIFSAEDAYTKIRLGASLVALITGMIFEGPQLTGQINQGLVNLLKRDGFTHISQAIGIDAM